MANVDKRYDFILFFDVQDGNPNGDPDAGNLPRVDAETGMGLVTDVCLKRKVRNYVQLTRTQENGSHNGYDIFVKEKAVLNSRIDEAYEQDDVKNKAKDKDKVEAARQWMCERYYDIRTFGAVLSTGKNAGQVRGPVQITFARSAEPVVALEHSITRVAKTTEERAETGGSEMGRKFTIPYGLYRAHGFVSAHLAAQTGFSQEDLELFWEALQKMFDHDHSAARGLMSTRALVIFEHGTALGTANAVDLFERVTVERKTEGPARKFSDYQILFDNQMMKDFPKVIKL